MSPIGRIFVVINLVLAGLFLGSAATSLASAQKYKSSFDKEHADRLAEKASLESEIGSLTAEKLAAETLRNTIKNEKDALEIERNSLKADIQLETDKAAQLTAGFGNFDTSLKDLTKQVETQADQVAQANQDRADAVEARREAEQKATDAVAEKAAADDMANDLTAQIADLNKRLTTTTNELAVERTRLDVALADLGKTREEIGEPAPKIEGAVLQVAPDTSLVHINRGSNDMVKRGYEFSIFSGGVLKGIAKVEIVSRTSCTALVTDRVDGTSIAQGDAASTRL